MRHALGSSSTKVDLLLWAGLPVAVETSKAARVSKLFGRMVVSCFEWIVIFLGRW